MKHRTFGTQQTARHLAREGSAAKYGSRRIRGIRSVRRVGRSARRGDLQQGLVLARRAACEPFENPVQPRLVAQLRSERGIALRAGTELFAGELRFRAARRFHQRRQRRTHHFAERTHVIVGDPLPQRPHAFVDERSPVQRSGNGFQGLEIGPAVVDAPHDARIDLAAAQWHGHGLSRFEPHPLGNGEREGRLRQRQDNIGIEHTYEYWQCTPKRRRTANPQSRANRVSSGPRKTAPGDALRPLSDRPDIRRTPRRPSAALGRPTPARSGEAPGRSQQPHNLPPPPRARSPSRRSAHAAGAERSAYSFFIPLSIPPSIRPKP